MINIDANGAVDTELWSIIMGKFSIHPLRLSLGQAKICEEKQQQAVSKEVIPNFYEKESVVDN